MHTEWLEDIREAVWARINCENNMIPSVDALWRHWKRTCWIIEMWSQADQNTIHLREITSYGWKLTADGELGIEWDSDSNIASIQSRVSQLMKGCKCKTGCHTARSCRKSGKKFRRLPMLALCQPPY